ncbi:MAG: YeeE/YedE family protein [Acidiferrobacterales bacterium]|nr:YeeE/YedE family protein [Acidiferrobacterales bacterium]
MELEHYQKIALYGFLGAMVFGAIASRTQFCTMGAVSDWVNMGSKTRMRVWFLVIAVAMVGTQIMHLTGMIDLRQSIYLSTNFTWIGHILGGFLFGIGMTIGSGCGQRTLVRIGGGNLKSLVLAIVLAITAYMTLRGLFALLRLEINGASTVDLEANGFESQGIPHMLSNLTGISATAVAIIITTIIATAAFTLAFRDKELRSSFDNWLAGIGLGVLIVGAWYVTGVLGFDDFDPLQLEAASFIAPVGNTLSFLMTYTGATINFGIAVVLGMIAGALVYSVITRTFRWESFNDRSDLVNHLYGGVLMGFGGVLSLGCTIGQGVSGFSTLALGAPISLISIIAGAAFTMKMQYYLYDEEGWMHALKSTLADLKPGKSG